MAGIGHRMVEQVSRGARLRREADHCQWGKPLVVTENSLLLRTTVPLGTHTCCQSLHLLLAPAPLVPTAGAQHPPNCSVLSVGASSGFGPNRPSGLLHLLLLLLPRGNQGRQPPAASNGPLTPTAGARAAILFIISI
ncbi:hypothetical protein MDA_GLEAN10023727 [Myotis davidii]|uniref:Uncharacterized protein n=1 Tax=Myotis davidii TaxID=225400 RepID=L5M7P6_MYODS|nr:hypothetical protein MDA_GLEAN10023727 [Myotis davidii]